MVLSIGYIVLFEILPESFKLLGWIALGVLFIGLLVPLVIEYAAEKATRYTHLIVIILIILGMGLHSFLDGTALIFFSKKGNITIPLLVIAHRFPVGIFIWRLFDKHPAYAIYSIAYLVLTTLMGFFFGQNIAPLGSNELFAYFEAFIAGSILHVIIHKKHCHLPPNNHSHKN